MRLVSRRSRRFENGWPWCLERLGGLDGQGTQFDDFADASYAYAAIALERRPWVGMFHHPPVVDSPVPGDQDFALRSIERDLAWQMARPLLRKAYCMSGPVADDLRAWLGVPVTILRHPARPSCDAWRPQGRYPGLVQVGCFLRDVNAITHVPHGVDKLRVLPNRGRGRERLCPRGPYECQTVTQVSWERYDELLRTRVVLTWFYAAAASNVVVECIERRTPLIVNRSPAVEEYLGSCYPLYCERLEQVPDLMKRARDASEYLAALPKTDLSQWRVDDAV